MYEQLLLGVKNHFNKASRTTGELSDKLHQLFEDNVADYDKLASWYDKSKPRINVIGGKLEYEHYMIENYKKSVIGDSYDVKEYKPFYQ